ncbi:MAG: hypothetical protein MRY59_00505, partial [Aquisalinus sp.]|nr:hypothetical protein [Aquisalinus sp.]
MLDDLKSDEELTTLATHATFIEGDLVFQSDLLKKPALEILPNEFFLAVKPPSVEHVQVSAGTNEEPSNEKIPSALDPMLQALWASQQPTIAARSNEGAKSANNHAEGPYQFFGEYVVVDVRAQDGM